jgi:hypothetical protein
LQRIIRRGSLFFRLSPWPRERLHLGVVGQRTVEEEADGSAPLRETAVEDGPRYVEFVVSDAAAAPVSGIPYRLLDPEGEVADEGTLGDDGKVRKDNVDPGLYELLLGVIESAEWPASVRAGEAVELRVQASGLLAGKSAELRIFRLGQEEDGDEVETLSAETDDAGAAAVEWTYQPEEGERGEIPFTFRAEIEGAWMRSEPLVVVIPDLHGAEWSTDRAAVGETAELVVQCPGVPPDSEISFEIRKAEDDEVVETLTAAPGEDGAARVEWLLPDVDPEAPYAALYFVATFDDRESSSWALVVVDAVEVVLKDDGGRALRNAKVVVTLPDGTARPERTDDGGRLRLEGLPPGRIAISVPGVPEADLTVGDQQPLRSGA